MAKSSFVKIPFSVLPPKILDSVSRHFLKWGGYLEKSFPFMQQDLQRADMKVEAKKYLAMCLVSTMIAFVVLAFFSTLFLAKMGKPFFGVVVSGGLAVLILFAQFNYPKLTTNRRIRKLDTELLAALRALMVQLNSGVLLFEALVIVSKQQFGEVSKEFNSVVKEINGGIPQIEALEMMALRNPSPYFRRTLWQITNGMKEGSNIHVVIENIVKNLTKEQIVQIEKYGSQLSPLAMFYMIGAVIIPALGVIFLIVLASFIEMDETLIKGIFYGMVGFVIFLQVVFSGIVKTKRPSLLED